MADVSSVSGRIDIRTYLWMGKRGNVDEAVDMTMGMLMTIVLQPFVDNI